MRAAVQLHGLTPRVFSLFLSLDLDLDLDLDRQWSTAPIPDSVGSLG